VSQSGGSSSARCNQGVRAEEGNPGTRVFVRRADHSRGSRRGGLTSVLANAKTRSAAEVLAEYDFDGDRLPELSRKIANDELWRRGAFLDPSRFDDLVGFLACAATRYDPERRQATYGRDGGDPFSVVARGRPGASGGRLVQKQRPRGIRIAGTYLDGTIVLSAMDEELDVDTDLDFEKLLSERRVAEWQSAAHSVELSLEEWIAITLDRAAKAIKQAAASAAL